MPVQVTVRLQFDGEATISIPDGVPPELRRALAENFALAQVLATFNNDDSGDCLECACGEFAAEVGDDLTAAEVEQLFDAVAPCGEPTGNWTAERPFGDSDADVCDECGNEISSEQDSLANSDHAESCSLYVARRAGD